jgi:dihydropteroate synthase/2-amino-4-hydroxy-6-hydroxymethyldihydropteridine diphosphokinase
VRHNWDKAGIPKSEIVSGASTITLALGSNLGGRLRNLQDAVDSLGEIMAVEKISAVYETMPWGIVDQPTFLNACLEGQTLLQPQQFLESIKKIEQKIGRRPGPRYGPRIIDIDILFFDDAIVNDDSLIIPHLLLEERAFVLAPLSDIASDFVHPKSGRRVEEMLASVGTDAVNRLDRNEYRLNRPIKFVWGVKTYVMGIINATPDSFSGDGLYDKAKWIDQAVKLAKTFVREGADILDIGGESTRPGSKPVPAQEELVRTIPAIKAIRGEVDVPISIDTYRASVAREGLHAGANWVNDVWGLRMDAEMAGLIGEMGCPVVIMHNRSKPKNVEQEAQLGGRYVGISYSNLMEDILMELQSSIDIALNAGIGEDQIIIDPGIGFGKTVPQNLQIVDKLDFFRTLGYPILVGPSRKSFIGYSLGVPPNDRMEGTAAAISIAIDRGADVVRVHDVKAMARVARMTDKIVR